MEELWGGWVGGMDQRGKGGLGPDFFIPSRVCWFVNLCPSPGLGSDSLMASPRDNPSRKPPIVVLMILKDQALYCNECGAEQKNQQKETKELGCHVGI
ncbi:unnamed protein product [Prunus armeniaca]|uniref:Uncharacterized protein n=1 Tax=Prunus armeniaca TaxID=36596 RepID=A0A6J5TP90_PRUAR|nr:unnamed protein product [Prunus armeniaca]